MPESQFNKNPKTKFQYEAKRDEPLVDMQPERGGCLSVYLAVAFFLNLIMVSGGQLLLDIAPFTDALARQYYYIANTIVGICLLACIAGLWYWQSWAYYGIYVILMISVAVNIIVNDWTTAIVGIGEIIIFTALMQDKTYYLK